MTPIEMNYSWIGLFYHATAWLGQRLAEKWLDVVFALLGTLLGYWLAKRHLEHFVSAIVEKMGAKYLDLNRQIAFHKAVAAMLPELPGFYVRPTRAFNSQVVTAIGEFTSLSTAVDPTHTPEKSMELVVTEAYRVAAELIQKDMGFKEAVPTPNFEWQIRIGPLPVGWSIEEAPDLTIYNWHTGAAVYRHALMKETTRTATSIRYSWMWDIKDVPCGMYVGVVNFTIGGTAKMQHTASPVAERLRVFLKRENGQIVKAHENILWDDKPADTK
ncbi:MAG: hypothetical protein ACRD8A_17180 [Candidatus Acidiferrales bacterium]